MVLIWSCPPVFSQTASPPSQPASVVQATGSNPLDLNLSSTDRTIQIGGSSPVVVEMGGSQIVINPGDLVTPAQFVAAQQFLSGGPVLQVSELGNAVGGTLVLNSSLSQPIGNLLVPQGVSAVRDFADGSALNLVGNLTNAGNFYALSTSQAVSSATIAAANITNLAGAQLTSVLPAGGLSGFAGAISQLNLNLSAVNNIVNQGSISSSGNLSMTAGGSIVNTAVITAAQNVTLTSAIGSITNSGVIAAAAGNININALMAQSLALNNAGGTLEAFNGNINLRDSMYNGSADLLLSGGDFLSRELNLYTGTGSAMVSVGQVTGSINTVAGEEHVVADTPLLKLGEHCISGDPTYYNTGSIEIIGTVSTNEDIAIVAGGDITADANGKIVSNGHNLLMIAGANISSCGACSPLGTVGPTSGGTPTAGLAEGPVTVSLTGGSGGNIDLSGSSAKTVIDTSSLTSAGGNVNAVALADGFGLKGEVKLNSGAGLGKIDSSGAGAGGGGNVTIYAGASFLGLITSISTNEIYTVSNGTSNSGNVTLTTTQAVTSDTQPLVLDAFGAITSGNTIQAGATLAQAGIKAGMIDTHINGGSAAGGSVNITAYGDIDTSSGVIYTINNGVGVSGEVNLNSSNGAVSTNGIYSFVYSGWLAASNVTISAYGDITTNLESIYTFQGGSGVGGTIDLTSSNGSISTGLIVTGVGDATAAGNVNMSAKGSISALSILAFNAGTGGGGSVALTSSTGSVLSGMIATNTNLGLLAAGNVTISAPTGITILGEINASNSGIGSGGNVTLLTQGALTTEDINTSSAGFAGGAICAAAKGDNGLYSIDMGNLKTSGSAAAGSVEIVSTDILEMHTQILNITAQASGQNGVGGAVGIATRGTLSVANIDTTNTSTSTISGAQSGSVFLSSGSTAINAISAGSITAHNATNGSATGQVILIASGTISNGAITSSAGDSSVNPNFTSLTPFISSSTTIDVSVSGISGLFSNYNPQGYLFVSGGSTTLTIDSGGNSSLLAPLLCLGDVSISSINANSGTQADAVSLAASGNITLSGISSVNTVGTSSGGNANLLSIGGQVNVGGMTTNSSGTGPAGNLTVSANKSIAVGGKIDASNAGGGAGGTVTMTSINGSVSVGDIDTSVSAGSGAAGSVSISAYAEINTNAKTIAANNTGAGAGGNVTLVSSTDAVLTGAIDTYVTSGTAAAGSVSITAFQKLQSDAIDAHNADSGSSGMVLLVSSNNLVSVGGIDAYVSGGVEKAADVTISSYGSIAVNGALSAYNTGSGGGSTINLLSANGSVTTNSINVDVDVNSIVAGNVNIEAFKSIDTSAGTIDATNGSTRPIDAGVTLLSHTSSITTGAIDISVTGGSAVAGNVSLSAPQFISVNGVINASNADKGSGGTVTLESTQSSVAVSQINTHVTSSSAQAGSVSILSVGSINASGAIDTSNAAGLTGTGSNGAAGSVTLISTSTISTAGINSSANGGSALAGNVTILADGSISASGVINASNAGTGAGGAIALTSKSGSVSLGGIQTSASAGSAAAGDVLISAPGSIAVTGAIATNNTASGAGGSLAMVSNGTISTGAINTSGGSSGSVFLSSGSLGAGAITTGTITLSGGPLLATAASIGSIAVQPFTDGNSLSVNGGQIYATGTYTSPISILPTAFANGATSAITPAMIPGGGFTSFSNSGTVTLSNDVGSSGNVISFSNLVPAFVQGTISSIGTINDSTGQSNFFLMAPSVSASSATSYTSATGSLSLLAGQMTLGDINTNGVNLNLTSLQALTIGTISTVNPGGTKSGNATLLSVIGAVTTGQINTNITSGSAQAGNLTISAYGNLNTNSNSINTSNSGIGAGGTVNLTTSGTGSIKIGQISTNVINATSNAAAGNVTIFSAAALDTNSINTSNSGSGAGGTVTLTSDTFSIATGDIDTHVTGGSAPAGNVFISALQDIVTANINASHGGTGTGGSLTLVRAAAMKTGDVDTSSAGFAGGSIMAASVGDNSKYSLEMGNLNTSGFTAAGSLMLVADDFADKPTTIGNITAQATGPAGVGGAVGVATLGKLTIGNIDTTNTAAGTIAGAQSGSVFLSSGLAANLPEVSISAGSINAYNSANGSATGQVILIATGPIKVNGTITTSAGTIPLQAPPFTVTYLSGTEASINPNYSGNELSISSSTTVNVSVAGISSSTSNFNPQGYAALSGRDTVLTIDSGGNSSLLAPLVFTAYVPMLIKSIKSANSGAADGIALVILGNLILSDGISANGTISGGNVTLQSSAGEISANYIDTHSSGAGAAGSINISAWGVIPVSGTIDASNTGTGAGGSVILASTTDSVVTADIKTLVTGGSASAGNVTVSAYQALSTQSIDASNAGTGAGGTVFLLSSDSSAAAGDINTSSLGGAAGNVFISAWGSIDYNGNVSAGSVTSNAGGNIVVNPGTTVSTTITATGSQTYNGALILNADTTLQAINNAVTFNSTVGGSKNLTINSTGGAISFNGNVGSSTPLGQITLTGNGTSTYGGTVNAASLSTTTGTNSINGGKINTSGAQTYNGNLVLGADTTFKADGIITLNASLNDNSANRLLQFAPNGGTSVQVVNNALLSLNGANSIIGFNRGAAGSIDLSGTGSLNASQVNFGNLNPNTVQILPPFVTVSPFTGSFALGNTSIEQTSIAGTLQVSDFIIPPPVPSTPSSSSTTNSTQFSGFSALSAALIASSTGRFPFSDLIPTDLTRSRGFVSALTELEELDNQLILSGKVTDGQEEVAIFAGRSFDTQALRRLSQAGVSLDAGKQELAMTLNRGIVLFAPKSNIVVTTKEGDVCISAGAIVLVFEDGNDSAVLNISDAKQGDVRVKIGSKSYAILPGEELVMTRSSSGTLAAVNPARNIAHRSARKALLAQGVSAYLCEFSLVSALSNTGLYNKLKKDKSLTPVLKQILVTAASLQAVTGARGPYKSQL